MNIIPITQARSKLGDLAEGVSGEDYVILTKGGLPEAVIVDYNYIQDLEARVRKIYANTFIDPKLVKYTRIFSDKEVKEWVKEDQL